MLESIGVNEFVGGGVKGKSFQFSFWMSNKLLLDVAIEYSYTTCELGAFRDSGKNM